MIPGHGHGKFSRFSTILIAALSVALMVSGCSTYRPMAESDAPALQTGDAIRYTLRDGRQGEMKIEAIDGKTIRGEDGATLNVADVTQVKGRTFLRARPRHGGRHWCGGRDCDQFIDRARVC